MLVRILRRTDRTGADELLAEAVPRHPDFAPLHFMLFRTYEERGDPRAVESLSKAIDFENAGSRRNAWLEELLDLSEGETARALGKAQLAKALAVEDSTVRRSCRSPGSRSATDSGRRVSMV